MYIANKERKNKKKSNPFDYDNLSKNPFFPFFAKKIIMNTGRENRCRFFSNKETFSN